MKKQKVNFIQHSAFPYIVADNWYSPEEEAHIWKEIEFLTARPENFEPADNEVGLIARNKDQTPKGKHNRLYPDRIFTQNYRDRSHILFYNRKQLMKPFLDFVEKSLPQGRHWKSTNADSTLISYYEDGDHYGAHWDSATTTILRWFFKEPKKFKGGDLTFTDSGEVVKCKHNRMILFPGYYMHTVDPIKINKKNQNKGLGRYTLTTFYYYK